MMVGELNERTMRQMDVDAHPPERAVPLRRLTR